jgi:hypothetical protein
MTNQPSRFIPPARWIEDLCRAANDSSIKYSSMNFRYEEHIAAQVAEWTQNEMTKAFLEWLQDHARLPDYSLDDRLRLSSELREYLTPLDKSDAADAARLRWMLNGHGYFLEEEGLCGHCGTESDKARREIDKQMAMEAKG